MGTNTGIGIGIGIPFKNNALGGDKPYFPPELKARMIGVWTNYGKKNTDTDRNIIKNKIPNAGGDLEILNAAYKLNSGFGEYKVDFLDWTINSSFINERTSFTFSSFNDTNNDIITVYQRVPAATQSFLIKAKLRGRVLYRYYVNNGDTISVSYYEVKEGINILPDSVDPTSVNGKVGFVLKGLSSIKVEQIPNFEDAFVTDGINDIIISQKTLQEMGVTKELTIVSMIHQISFKNSASVPLTNYIRPTDNIYARNQIADIGKTGIYGYVVYDIKNSTVENSHIVNTILGDKNDYSIYTIGDLSQGKFSVQGYIDSNGNICETSSVAHYWTFAVLGKVTEDEINLIIGNYNLDRSLEPDILCNIGKQGITNDNHADFNDKLVDYSGNSRDIQTYNLAWKGGSGIAAKPFETIKDYIIIISDETRQKLTIYNEFSYKIRSNAPNRYWIVQSIIKDNTSYQVTIITDKDCYWINATSFTNSEGNKEYIKKEYPVKANTPTQVTICGLNEFEYPEGIEPTTAISYVNLSYAGEITVTFIPSYKGGLLLDGINDFGKVTGMPIYKDYTFIIDREIISIGDTNGIVASKSEDSTDVNKQGAFLFEYLGAPNNISTWSFYKDNGKVANTDFTRGISYQSKYSYNGIELLAGTALDSDKLWLGILRDKDSRFANVAIYSLMSFPYSMSKFLIERQLKKHKLGTLYPDMAEFRPIVESNVKYQDIIFRNTSTGEDLVAGQYYDLKAISIFIKPNNIDEVSNVRVNNTNTQFHSYDSNSGYYRYDVLINKSPQKINITIDEYIRYEDIVQPYPVLLRFKDESGKEVSWGDKIKVGSSITRIGSFNDCNLLKGIYTVSNAKLNGSPLPSTPHVVEKSMVFTCTATWAFDNNEPKCILSPRLLRIPNSSYKILGHIPDISGHSNHGKINNSAYASMSGANGYLLDFKTFTTGNSSLVNIKDDSRIEVININKEKSTTWVNLNKSTSISLSSWKIKVTGIKSGDTLGYYYSESTDATLRSKFDIKSDGIYSLPSSIANSNNIGGIAFDIVVGADSAYRIEQIGEYEGAYCLDGVDDFVTIPTTVGGKQVLMKVNWQSIAGTAILYDQRTNGGFAIFNRDFDTNENKVPAYRVRNIGGSTYIDGILNKYIYASELKDITHNIVELCDPELNTGTLNPKIGSSYLNSNYTQMSLYDFMLFDEISTDDKILELNEYVGIEAKVELPPYYWDTYGKTNLDADKATIQQRGVAIGDYDLTNYNHAYEGMSGYNGYPIILSGTNRTYQSKASYTNIVGDDKNVINLTRISFNTASIFSYVKQNEVLTSYNKDVESFKIKVTGIDYSRFIIKYSYISKANATNKTNMDIVSDGIYELPKSFASDGSLTSSNVWIGISFTKQSNDIPDIIEDVNVTIEVLPEYENGLAYDGVEDFSDNKNIPLIDDFTVIAKRTWLEVNTSDKPFIIKGDTLYPDGNKNAFLFEYGKLSTYSFGQNNKYDESVVPSLISWAIPTSYNGTTSLVRGGAIDTVGIDIAHATKIVLYKLILYPKTIPLLQINFLKNLMEKDEIIDLNNPIFIKNE